MSKVIKKIKRFFSYATAIILLTVLPFSFTACGSDDCDDITKGAKLADLVLDIFESVFNDDNPDDQFYEVSHTIINSTSAVLCPGEVDQAGSHIDMLPLLFSETADFSNPQVVEEKEVQQSNVTDAGQSYVINSKIVFDVDGFYSVNSQLDTENDVDERDENNNESMDAIRDTSGGRSTMTFTPQNIISVKGTGNTSPCLDADGKLSYVSRWDVEIVQQ
jgi:hypothetical protein